MEKHLKSAVIKWNDELLVVEVVEFLYFQILVSILLKTYLSSEDMSFRAGKEYIFQC